MNFNFAYFSQVLPISDSRRAFFSLRINSSSLINSDCLAASIISPYVASSDNDKCVFKHNNNYHIIDPWKQTADIGTRNLIKLIPNLTFIKRKADSILLQVYEGDFSRFLVLKLD